jgi:hypothetical protein
VVITWESDPEQDAACRDRGAGRGEHVSARNTMLAGGVQQGQRRHHRHDPPDEEYDRENVEDGTPMSVEGA